jgi:hypothetical protein
MTPLGGRARRVRAGGDTGSALAIALVFLLLFGVFVGDVLQFAATGQRTTLVVRDEAMRTYAGGGALDGAINQVRTTLTTGTAAAGPSTCFTLPSGLLDNPSAVTVTCQPRAGSGADLGGGTASQPDQAVLALSSVAAEGVLLGAASTLPTRGSVLASRAVTVPAAAALTSTGAVRAGSACLVTGTSSPACATGSVPGDPGWAAPTAYPPLVGTVPACTGSIVRLQPGTYQSAAALQTALACPVVWLAPGTYNFDFRNAGTHELTVGAGTVVVGGAPSGWTPGTTPAASIPFPTAANPTASACDTSADGVDVVFGGDSRLNVTGGKVQLCALSTSSSAQHIVSRGLSAATSRPGTGTSTAAASSDVRPAGSRAWSDADQGATVDGSPAYVKVPNTGSTPSRLRIGPVSTSLVPGDATSITVTATVAESVSGSGNTTLVGSPGDGSANTAAVMLRDCPAANPCSAGGLVPGQTDSATFTGLTPSKVNGMSFELVVTNPENSPVDAWVDGLTVSVSYTAPLRPTCVLAAPTGACTAGLTATPVLKAAGAATVLALHGTVYAPLATLDLGLTSVPYEVVDRGVVVRHLLSTMTPAAGYSGPLISIPPIGQQPRHVLLVATDGTGQVLARADVTFADSTGTENGSIPRVNEWSVS